MLARPEPVDNGSAGSISEKTDAKGDYSVSEDDKVEHEEFPEFLGGGVAEFYDFRAGFVKFLEKNGSRPLALLVTTSSRSQTRLGRKLQT